MKLTLQQIMESLNELEGWEYSDNFITKKFEFKDFTKSIKFVNKVAKLAEKEQHHPDISLDYNIVVIRLSTHSENGITNKDINLAKNINSL